MDLLCAHKLDVPPDLEEMWADIYAWLIFLDSHCASNGVYIERLRRCVLAERLPGAFSSNNTTDYLGSLLTRTAA